MKKYQKRLMAILIIFISGCSDNGLENQNIGIQNFYKQDGSILIPDTYVQGYVYSDYIAQTGATVQLLDENFNVLTSTTTNLQGFYSIIICPYNYGYRYVKAIYYKHGNLMTNVRGFEFSYEAACENDWIFNINLYLMFSIESIEL